MTETMVDYTKASINVDGNLRLGPLARVIAGNCPECGRVVAVVNHGESWPLMKCGCGWRGDTHAPLNKVRVERVAT